MNNSLLQGYVLSPVLFNIFIASLHKKLSDKVQIFKYEDGFLILATEVAKDEAEVILHQQRPTSTSTSIASLNCQLTLTNLAQLPWCISNIMLEFDSSSRQDTQSRCSAK